MGGPGRPRVPPEREVVRPAPSAGAAADQVRGSGTPVLESVSLDTLRVAIEVEIPSDIRYIEPVVELVTRQCEEFAFPARFCALNVPVALSEALSNAILRGNGEDREKHVRVRAAVTLRGIVMEVADEGGGFDLDRCTLDPTENDNLLREDGRGLFLMRSLMDRVERYIDGGNVVRLTLSRT
jgi:serine/threonine-protein kinase RsbW